MSDEVIRIPVLVLVELEATVEAAENWYLDKGHPVNDFVVQLIDDDIHGHEKYHHLPGFTVRRVVQAVAP